VVYITSIIAHSNRYIHRFSWSAPQAKLPSSREKREHPMPDLHVVAVLTAKPGSESVLEEALRGLVEPTRAEEGCLGYELFRSNADPLSFVTVERWRSQEDLDAHMQTPHITAALQAAGDAFASAPAIHPLVPIL
jgi:quinol monooxygenase YgiN